MGQCSDREAADELKSRAQRAEERSKKLEAALSALKIDLDQREGGDARPKLLTKRSLVSQQSGTLETSVLKMKEEGFKNNQLLSAKDKQIEQLKEKAMFHAKQLQAIEDRAEELEDELESLKNTKQFSEHLEAENQKLRGSQELTEQELQDALDKSTNFKKQASELGHRVQDLKASAQIVVMAIRPLQQAIRDGDAESLKREIDGMRPYVETEEIAKQHYLEFSDVIGPFFSDAESKLKIWQDILNTIHLVIKQTQSQSDMINRRQAKRLFVAIREGSITGLVLEHSDSDASAQVVKAFMDFWVQEGGVGNSLQTQLVQRVVGCRNFRDFDFTDMSCCLSYVDKEEVEENNFFIDRARTLCEEHPLHELRRALSSLETILFFLRFLNLEDLALTYQKYRSTQNAWLTKYLAVAESQYCPGKELVDTTGRNPHDENDVKELLAQLKASGGKGGQTMDALRTIFSWWAEIMQDKFNLLVLPHHTQIVCMLICLEFVKNGGKSLPGAGAVIAEMGTGEGKSAVIAVMALYCAAWLKMKVHVVVDDEHLVERDFRTYQDLFNMFRGENGEGVTANLCVSASRKESKFKSDDSVTAQVPDDADIVYCEAKHIQSFYTRNAKIGGKHFADIYNNRMLILDEVDALVIDESPNVPFVYESEDLSLFATQVAEAIASHKEMTQIEAMAKSGAQKKVFRSMWAAAQTASKWKLHQDFELDMNSNRYFRVQGGRVCESAWSLALEYKNFADHFSDKIVYNERLFVLSRPRAFRTYGRIVGLSGSVGNDMERDYLKKIYKAEFFKVPAFLHTCRNSPYYTAVQKEVIIEENEHLQWQSTCDKAFEYREKVPVLIIAPSRQKANLLSAELQAMANAKGLRAKDVVRSLSRDTFESFPEQYKENLFQCTQPMDKGSAKKFRITVTDPRGGRGTDYHVTDPDADRNGGLLLIIQEVPKQARDWAQYLGRTARQDRHGQWMAVLNRQAYAEEQRISQKNLQPEDAVQTILGWGNQETQSKVAEIHEQYHRGLRLNELSEEIAKRHLLTKDKNREIMVHLCNDFSRMSIQQIDELAAQIEGLNPRSIKTEAEEVGPDKNAPRGDLRKGALAGAPRSIIILIDRSASMMSRDCGGKTRFDVCKNSIMRVFNNNVEDHDYIGLYTFESEVRESFPLTKKGPNRDRLANLIENLPPPDGLTRFYDGVLHCMNQLRESPAETRYLIALTDGDDNMSTNQPNGEMVSAMVRNGVPGLNLICITVGTKIKQKMVEIMNYWILSVQGSGQLAMYIPADRPDQLESCFEKVAEAIDADGEIET
mmetsp:Transcript_49288/g.107270  ORF Transcript_49288/g.107270 Transcript_49288/m.107270 type:complete len:1299 (-) Transcript_49288:82-3978(-)